jgi:hypothetical protein
MKAHPTQFIPVGVLSVPKRRKEKIPVLGYECNMKKT